MSSPARQKSKSRPEGRPFRLLTNPIPKESHGKLRKHAICCKTNGWNMGSLREVSSALQARRREHAGDRATNFGENGSFRCSRAPTTTCGGPPPSRREAGVTSSLYLLLNATQRCHFVISLKEPTLRPALEKCFYTISRIRYCRECSRRHAPTRRHRAARICSRPLSRCTRHPSSRTRCRLYPYK